MLVQTINKTNDKPNGFRYTTNIKDVNLYFRLSGTTTYGMLNSYEDLMTLSTLFVHKAIVFNELNLSEKIINYQLE